MASCKPEMLYQLNATKANRTEVSDTKVNQERIKSELQAEIDKTFEELMKDYQENPYKFAKTPYTLETGIADIELKLDLKERAKNAVQYSHRTKLSTAFMKLDIDTFLKELEIQKILLGQSLSERLFSNAFYGDFTYGIGGAMLRYLHYHEKGYEETVNGKSMVAFTFTRNTDLIRKEFTSAHKEAYIAMLQALADAGCYGKFNSLGNPDCYYREEDNSFRLSKEMLKNIVPPKNNTQYFEVAWTGSKL